MKSLQVIMAILGVLIVAPIWYYLLYKILVLVNATELMWFLYWIYLPAALLTVIVNKVLDINKVEKK